ncbi:hypothetical protein CYCD_15400 [Tenuifilaceae bacterium CYCD]|nr:hypothetical protein CYCD_15400 [Tenuifilaceae bacterium CYCD]
MLFRNISLRLRMLILFLGISTIVYLFVFIYLIRSIQKDNLNNAHKYVSTLVTESARSFQDQLNNELSVTKTLAVAMQGFVNADDKWRLSAQKQMQYDVLKKHKNIRSLWVNWDLSKFDRRSGSKGRLRCTYYWENDAVLYRQDTASFENLSDKSLWVTKNLNGNTILEPYLYKYKTTDNKKIHMTSLISPIVYNGELVGTVGCDIDLTEIKERVDKLQLFSNSYSFLLSNGGIYVSHPDTSVIGKTMAEINAEDDREQHISEKIAKGESFKISAVHSETGKQVVAYFNPILMEGSDSPWCLGIMVIIDDVLDESRSKGIVLFVIGLIGLLLITVVIATVSNQISARVIKGVNFASKISEGDLKVNMDDKYNDEIGRLSKSLSGMAERLRNTFKNIGNVSDEIVDSGQTMNTNAEALNTTVEELSNTSTDVTDAVRKVMQSIEQSNSNVQKAREISLTAVYTIKKGTDISQQALDAMTKVTNKIQVINDIAFQTNILALNAAVEAARAGEHGRGFAVVAGEVRKLAERSKQAASEIVDLSRTSLSTVDEVRTVMEMLVSEINKTADITVEIARNFEQQLEQTHTINESMSKLNDVSNMTGDAARDLASYSDRLLQLAGNLKETAKHFHY